MLILRKLREFLIRNFKAARSWLGSLPHTRHHRDDIFITRANRNEFVLFPFLGVSPHKSLLATALVFIMEVKLLLVIDSVSDTLLVHRIFRFLVRRHTRVHEQTISTH